MTPAQAGRIDRLIWNALRFSQHAEFFQDVAGKAGLPLAAFDLRYDTFAFPSGHYSSVNPGFQLGLSEKGFFYTELPLGIADWDGSGARGGFGDIIFEYQHVFFSGKDGKADSLVLALDLIAPTGDADRGIGEGAWIGFPSLTGVVEVGEKAFFAPTLAYLHSFGPVQDRASSAFVPGKGIEADARQGLLSLNLVRFVGDNSWVLVSPDVAHDFDSGDTTLDLRAGLGVQVSEDVGINVQYSQHLGGPIQAERSLLLGFSYFF